MAGTKEWVSPQECYDKSVEVNEALFPSVVYDVIKSEKPRIPIYIYNTANLYHNVQRPPNHPRLYIKACPPGEPWVLVGQIQHPFTEVDYDQNGNKIVNDNLDGFKEATRMLNPLNWGTDQNVDTDVSELGAASYGQNLNSYGVFWSVNYPPTDQELAAARARVEKTFLRELATLTEIEAKDPKGVFERVNRISHAAAEMFPEDRTWHRTNLKEKTSFGKLPCPACGEPINKGAIICKSCDAVFDEEAARKFFPGKFSKAGRPPKKEEVTEE